MVEIMVALTVFSVGASVAMRALPESKSSTNKSRNIAKATNIAQEKLEELLDLKYDNSDLDDGVHMDTKNPIQTHFTRNWSVTADSPVANMKTIEVSVAYPPNGDNDKVTLKTAITIGR
jgi:type II secretory pathway pseudopilin PulG